MTLFVETTKLFTSNSVRVLDTFVDLFKSPSEKTRVNDNLSIHPFSIKCREPSHGSRTDAIVSHVIASDQP